MKITLYTTPTCAYCVMLKRYFDEKNIKYQVVDVSKDPAEAEKMQEKSGQLGVPVVVFADDKDNKETVVVGFDKNKIDSILNIS